METIIVIILLVLVFVFLYSKQKKGSHSNASNIDSDVIRFYVDEANPQEINQCAVGDNVNLWVPSYEPKRIFLYRQGTDWGKGKIGYVPIKYLDRILYQVESKSNTVGKIIERSDSKLRIEYRLKSSIEIASDTVQDLKRLIGELEVAVKNDEPTKQNFKEELTKKYAPRQSIEVNIEATDNADINNGEKLKIEFKDLEVYLEQEYPEIIFKNLKNEKIGKLNSKKEVVRILKAHFNNYQFDIEVINNQIDYDKNLIRVMIKPIKRKKIKVSFFLSFLLANS